MSELLWYGNLWYLAVFAGVLWPSLAIFKWLRRRLVSRRIDSLLDSRILSGKW